MNIKFKNKIVESIKGISILDIDCKLEDQEYYRNIILDNLFSDSYDILLEDYLGRNRKVVVKNIETDNLSKMIFIKLWELEKSNKNRQSVLDAIELRLN